MIDFTEVMPELFTRSKLLILDFSKIPAGIIDEENIQKFFEHCIEHGINPRKPENRQKFNNKMLGVSGQRYLVSQYGEDRVSMLGDTHIAKEGRTIHMGVDIFSKDLEQVSAPSNGTVVMAGHEEGFGEYGNYLIFQPEGIEGMYIFLGHLAKDSGRVGSIKQGTLIGHLGDYIDNENGGWSRHLHLQIITRLPDPGLTPIGYSTKDSFGPNSLLFPDPMPYFPNWRVLE